MGILEFFSNRIEKARRSKRCSPAREVFKDFGRANSLGKHFNNDDNDDVTEVDVIKDDGFIVRSFNWDEIVRVTRNFSRVIGSGGFSNVYLAHLPATLAAIKTHCSTSERLYRVFKQELDILLHINRHDHIVELIGYYDDQEKGLLVLEYMQNGTLQEKLHSCDDGVVLSWTKRMQIAYQMALAVEHLHEKCSPHIVHGDIKSSNILLDNNLDSKLCDFGSAKMGFSSKEALLPCKQRHSFTMTGSPGYVDPHYLRTGISSKKNDIYSFGVLLFELITGMEAFSAQTGQMLTSLVNHGDEVDFAMGMVDPLLIGNFDLEEAALMFSVAGLCLGHSPALRPSASDIVFSMQHQIPSIFPLSKHHKNL